MIGRVPLSRSPTFVARLWNTHFFTRRRLNPRHHTPMNHRLLLSFALVLISLAQPARAAIMFADWTSASGGSGTGTVNGVGFAATFSLGNGSAAQIDTVSLTAPTWTPDSGGAVDIVDLGSQNTTTLTFDEPVTNFALQFRYWRGPIAQGPTDYYTFSGSFSGSPSIVSGNAGMLASSLTGNQWNVTGVVDMDGTIGFSGSVTSLTITPGPGVTINNGQQFTFSAVPEPSTYAMALAGLACGGYVSLRRRK